MRLQLECRYEGSARRRHDRKVAARPGFMRETTGTSGAPEHKLQIRVASANQRVARSSQLGKSLSMWGLLDETATSLVASTTRRKLPLGSPFSGPPIRGPDSPQRALGARCLCPAARTVERGPQHPVFAAYSPSLCQHRLSGTRRASSRPPRTRSQTPPSSSRHHPAPLIRATTRHARPT